MATMQLVMGASQATINSLLVKLGGVLAEEYSRIRGVRGDIQFIKDELASMQAFLGDLSTTRRYHDRQTTDWMTQIRDASYDIEDCIDDFVQRLSHDPGGDIFCAFVVSRVYEVLTWRPRRDIACRIAELKMRAQHIGERRTRYGVTKPICDGGPPAAAADEFDASVELELQRRLQLLGTKKPVGVDKEMEELGMWMAFPSPHDDPSSDPTSPREVQMEDTGVLSIVGFGGVGKTTIAMALYQQFGDQFDRRVMVTVSRSSDIEAILRSILSQVMLQSAREDREDQASSEKRKRLKRKGHRQQPRGAWTSEMGGQLMDQLENNSYLLLLDDLWSAATWFVIKRLLPPSKKASRIIVTTRFQAVANACSGKKEDHVHTVDVLSEEKARDLFLDVVAEENQKDIPSKFWEVCGGLPLTIVTMAGRAACNSRISQKQWDVLCCSLPPSRVELTAQDRNKRILDHCYNDMPAEIRTCSLYLSIFPEGRKVSRKRLIRRWIAEGSVLEKQGMSVEDIAEAYFNHLIRRKIILAVEHSSNGKVKSYQVHDMVLDCIVSKASQENFVTVIGSQGLMPTPGSKPRRLTLQGGYSARQNALECMNLSHVRSLTVFGSLTKLPSNSFKFGILQVLDLEGCMGFRNHHLVSICKMVLLKYLNLRRTDIKELPLRIGDLQYLETLDIRETNVTDLPRSLYRLERLVNILGGNKRTRKAFKLDRSMRRGMKALRVLSGIEIVDGSWVMADLHHLTDLRKLAIYKIDIMEGGWLFDDLRSSVEYLVGHSLCTLVIREDHSDFVKSIGRLSSPFLSTLELSGKMVELPGWITQLDALTKLTLSVTVLSSDALGQLSQLMKLFSLTFSLTLSMQDQDTSTTMEQHKAQSDGEIRFPVGGFGSLKLLRLIAPLLPPLRFPEDAVPSLERLELRFSVLEGLHGIQNPRNLKEVLMGVHSSADEATKSIVQDVATAAREDAGGPKVLVHQYVE